MLDIKYTKETDWIEVRKLIGNTSGLMNMIQNYDLTKIDKKRYNKLKSVYDKLSKKTWGDYKRISMACASFFTYFTAMLKACEA